MKFILLIHFCLFTLIISAQQKKPAVFSDFKKHSERLFANGGKWIIPAKEYDRGQDSVSHYLIEFSKGVGELTVSLNVSAYMRRDAKWISGASSLFTWQPGKRQVEYYSVNSGGEISKGRSISVSESEMVLEYTMTDSEGKTNKGRFVQQFAGASFRIIDYHFENGKWEIINTSDLQPLQEPRGSITFMSTRDGNWEIYSMNTKGENLKNLSCSKATDYMFSYFPGSNRFVYYSNKDGNDDVYIMSADGKKQTNITNHPSSDRIATVSRKGDRILFLSERDHKEGEIYIMDTLGNNVTRLTSNEWFEDLPVFSPDGMQIMFTRSFKEKTDSGKIVYNGEIMIMDADGTNERQITFTPGSEGGAQFSPDGKHIAYHAKSAEGNYDIFIMDVNGKDAVNITNDKLEDYSPYWSPDGKWIACTSGSSVNYDVWIINLETKIRTKLTTHSRRDESPVWRAE